MDDTIERMLGQILTAIEASLDQRLVEFDFNVKASFAENRNKLLNWIIGLLLGQTAILAALVKLL